jgi:hypothetical protein
MIGKSPKPITSQRTVGAIEGRSALDLPSDESLNKVAAHIVGELLRR